jgi:predicted ATPase/DNA-binding winged helix-turn-helix (wHTH) protein
LDSTDIISFGAFTLLVRRKQLLFRGEPVAIGQRALDLLIALAERPGEVLDRDTLLAAVWPGRQVEESNLRAQVALLRKALGGGNGGEGFVLSVPGRGYSFVAPFGAEPEAPAPAATLPLRVQSVLGRDADIDLVAGRLRDHRFVSIIGAGGIGKTTVALSVARRWAHAAAAPPVFIDFGGLNDDALAAGQVLSALEASGGGGGGIGTMLARTPRLVVLDSCEPVIEAVATLAEAMLQASPEVRLLATSREPLRAEGEWTFRLPSMATPPAGAILAAGAVMGFPAVALFAERIQAAGGPPLQTDEDAALAARICRQLDGIPLAIELAATRAASLGLQALAERLDDRFKLLMHGRRTALPRHQTLRATLDWSYDLLPSEEQRLLRRLAVFRGGFTLEAAVAVTHEARSPAGAPDGEAAAAVVDIVARLVDKSFLTLDGRPGGRAYLCLDTTRTYLLDKLQEAGEAAEARLRHARHFEAVFREAETLWATLSPTKVRDLLIPDLDNLRAAIDWSLGPDGDRETGIALTLAGVPFWSAFGMTDEARRRLEVAVAAFQRLAAPDPRTGMRLHAALGAVTVHLQGTMEAAWVETLGFAERLGDTEYQLRALNGLAVGAMRRDYQEALRYGERFRTLAWASGGPDDGPVGDRLIGYIQHMRGHQAEARKLTKAMLARYPGQLLQPHRTKLNFYDQRILSMSTLARILWLQGEAEAAFRLADEAVQDAERLENQLSLFFALGVAAAPLALLAGEPERAAAARTKILETWPTNQGYVLRGRSFLALEMIAGAEPEQGLALLREQMAAMPAASFNIRLPELHAGLAGGLLRLGQPKEALQAVDAALADARGSDERWFEPEYMRLRGECLIALGAAEAASAELNAALRLAEEQTALAWSLRIATSLAALHADEAAMAELLRLAQRFPPGLDTRDLRRARVLLASR